jgi:hypothetical protein
MATLATLKRVKPVKTTRMPAVQVWRIKMSRRLWALPELARAHAVSIVFSPVKFCSYQDKETGL